MDYGKYKNARNASWQCILDFNVNKLPVIVTDIIKKSENIRLFKDSDVHMLEEGESGKTILHNGFFEIVYRDTEPSYRCRFTISHELGHIFLGHLLINTPVYRTFAIRDDLESSANVFARDLLAPACVLHAFFGDMAINSITATTVRKWQTELISSPENYSQTYLKTINNQLSAIFNFAVKYYNLKSNPARDCGSMGKKKADSMQFWTQAEFNSFISVVDDITDRAIFMLLYYSGMRSGELFALTLSDFDFSLKTVSINKNYARQNGEDLILTPKTEKSKRIVSLPDFMIAAIKEYANKLYDLSPTQRLFPNNKYTLNKHMVKYCKKANVKKIRIHDLRHSHASLLIELGFSPLLISERLGHENIETTLQTYSHLYPNKQSEVASKLEELHNNF